MSLNLPQESKPESKEIVNVQKTDVMYIPTGDGDELPKEISEAKAIGIMNMTSPTSPESVLTMSKMIRPAILRGNFLSVFEARINQLRGKPANLIKPLYPRMSFLSQMKNQIDLQSVGDGSARMEMTAILSTPEYQGFGDYGGMGGKNAVFENIRQNYKQPLPPHVKHLNEKPPKAKRSLFNRNKEDQE